MLIQRMRDNSDGLVAKIIVGLIIVVFAMFGFGSITTFLAPVAKVAQVNGTNITQQAMEQAVERNRRIMLAQNPSATNLDEDRLRQNVLQSLITRELLTQEVDDLDLRFSDAALDEEITQTPAFQVDGVFNRQQYQLVLSSAGFTPTSYRQAMRRDKEFEQLNSAIAGSSFVTLNDVRRASSLAQQTRDIAYLIVDPDTLKDSVTVSEDEIETYYNENPDQFTTEETVNLEYVELKRSDLMAEVDFTEAELVAHFEDTKDLYAEPERRRVAHILIEVNDDVSDEAAKKEADAVYAKIKDGQSFSDLAKEYSDDPGSAENGGDLGFSDPGTFVEDFEATAYDLSLNQVSEPVKTEFGYHIIKLLGIEEAKTPELAEVRDRVEKDYRRSLAEDLFVTRSARLDEIAFESQDLIEPAELLNLKIKETGPVTKNASEGIAANSAVMEAAFSSDVLLDGNNSSVIEINPSDHIVLRVKEYQPSEVQPLPEVTDVVKATLTKEKASKLAEQQAKEMVAMLESGSVTRYVADQYGLEWKVIAQARRNQPDMEPSINRSAFSLARPAEEGKTVGYTVLPDGGAAVLSVTNVQNSTIGLDPMQQQGLQRVLAARQGSIDYQSYQESLRQSADISQLN